MLSNELNPAPKKKAELSAALSKIPLVGIGLEKKDNREGRGDQ